MCVDVCLLQFVVEAGVVQEGATQPDSKESPWGPETLGEPWPGVKWPQRARPLSWGHWTL